MGSRCRERRSGDDTSRQSAVPPRIGARRACICSGGLQGTKLDLLHVRTYAPPQPMKVAFIGTYGLWTPHSETELDIAEKHLIDGDEVKWVLCDAAFEACEPNPDHHHLRCKECQWRVQAGLRRLSGPVHTIHLSRLLTHEDRSRIANLPTEFGTTDEIKAVEVDGLDAGWGALSTAIWLARDANIDPADPIVPRLIRAGATSYLATRRFLQSTSIDRVYAFNGRMAPMRGILRAARDSKVECMIHERGQDLQHYGLFRNAMPHEIAATVKRVEDDWAASELDEEEKRRIGASWFEGRPKGQMGSWISFVAGQGEASLPDEWRSGRHNVVLFTTSEFEFVSIGKEWGSPLFTTPHAATMEIAREISRRCRSHLTIRIHPNPEGAKSSNVREALGIDLPHVTVIAPESDVSTYALMRAADVVVTSGSTTGVEATFWKTPSVLAGPGLYSGLGAAHEPRSVEELYELLEKPDLEVADRDAALRYGFHQATRGEPHVHFQPTGITAGTFKGERLRPSRLQRRILKLRWKMKARRS